MDSRLRGNDGCGNSGIPYTAVIPDPRERELSGIQLDVPAAKVKADPAVAGMTID